MHRSMLATIVAIAMSAPLPLLAQPAPSGMAHDMDSESLRVLREKVASYRTMTDKEINEGMGMMPPDWTWFGPDGVRDKVGVLVVAHGSGTNGDKIIQDGVGPIAKAHPTAIGYGMAMMGSSHLQQAVNKLTENGAETIVIVPAVVTDHSSVFRQWDYIFGRRPDSAYLDVPLVKTKAKVVMAPAMGEHPMITKVLADHAKEVSKDPSKEVVILLGHGPESAEENKIELAHMETHAKRIKAEGKYSDVRWLTLQDDAPDEVRSANVKKLRGWVEEIDKAGKTPVVVGYLISTRGIQHKIDEDLKGLKYTFQTKGISAHPNFTAWIRTTVDEQLAKL